MRLIFRIFADYRMQIAIQVALAVFLSLSMMSYNSDDPSLNNYSENDPINLMGFLGSVVADILLQFFGIGALVYIVLSVCWAKILFQNRRINFWSIKFFLGTISATLFSVAGAYFKINLMNLSFGGLLGEVLCPWASVLGPIAPVIICMVAIIFLVIASGHDLRTFFGRIFEFCGRLFSKSNKIVQSAPNFIPSMPSLQKTAVVESYSSNSRVAPKIQPEFSEVNLYHKSESRVHAAQNLEIKKQSVVLESPLPEFVDRNNGNYQLPLIDLLDVYNSKKTVIETPGELQARADMLMSVLGDFGVRGTMLGIKQGPVVTLYEFEPSAGTKSSRVIGLADDIARSISAISTRIAVIPGKNALGIEVPNVQRQFFSLRELITTSEYSNSGLALPIILGKDLGGAPAVVDLAKMPHLLVAGTTGSGKSVAINAMIISLLYRHTADTCKFIMIDPKMLELSVYQDIPHLLTPVVTEPGKAVIALKWAVREMENRYRLMSHLNVRNISGYNSKLEEAKNTGEVLEKTIQTGFDHETGKPIYESVPIEMTPLPFIVVIVDEMADLMLVAGKDIETSIQRLAQMARAAGIHLIMATQRPSVDVITGVIKANFPSRVSFKVTSKIDSRTILGEQGAEQLLGMGDMLYVSSVSSVSRLHGPFVDDKEVERIAKFLKSQGSPSYLTSVTEVSEDGETTADIEDGDEDSLYEEALQIVKRDRKISTSYIQRCLRIGYNRAATIVERMEREGAVSPPSHSGKREILLPE